MKDIFIEAYRCIKKEELFIIFIISIAMFISIYFNKYIFLLFFTIILSGFYLEILKEGKRYNLITLLINGVKYIAWFLSLLFPIYLIFVILPTIVLKYLNVPLIYTVIIVLLISFFPFLLIFFYFPIGEVDFAKFGFRAYLRMKELFKKMINVKYIIFITILYLIYSLPALALIFIFINKWFTIFLFILANNLIYLYCKKAELLHYKKEVEV
ncbi:hypothetical protein [Methanocaldococcus infernus]